MSAKLAALSPRFDAFLFASVGESHNGTLVSVLSALARFDLDPWQEAEALADLPQAEAADRLDEMILALADVPSVAANHHVIATRLVALLPQAGTIQTTVHKAIKLPEMEQRNLVIVWVAVMLISLVGQTIASRPNVSDSSSDTSGAMSEPLTRLEKQTP